MIKQIFATLAMAVALGGLVGVTQTVTASATVGGNHCSSDDAHVRLQTKTKRDCKVTPTEPTWKDVCGTKKDSFTIPETKGVKYYANLKYVAAGSYKASNYAVKGYVLITAVAKPGYKIEGQSVWKHKFTNEKCKPNLSYVGDCDEAKQAFVVTVTNSGDGDGTYMLNDVVYPVVAGGSDTQQVHTGTEGADVKLVINGETVLDRRYVCIQGQGAATVTTPEVKAEVKVNPEVASLPLTSGSNAGMVSIATVIVSALTALGSVALRVRTAGNL